jgi:glycosyltransferase involved in cell wall biosynthesis
MNVLVLHSELGVLWGGGETFTTNLFVAFAKRGHRVTATFVADRQGRYPRVLPSCFEPMPLPGVWSRKPGQAALSAVGARIPKPVKSIWDRAQEAVCWRSVDWHNRRFERRVETALEGRWEGYEAVYVNGNVGLAHKAAHHRPTLLMLPGPVSDNVTPLMRNIHAVCAHDDGFDCIRGLLGADRAIELPLGLDSEVFTPGPSDVRAELGWTDRDLVVGYVGRLALIKGVDLLAAAFAETSRSAPHARLLVVGSGEEEQRIRTVLSAEIARGIVHIERRMNQAQLPRWYRAMDVLAMPSRYETMSNAVLEGMACGVPFVASEVGGSKSLGKTKAGWLFEPESASALVDALKTVVESGTELRSYGERGRRHVHQHYSWTSSAERLENILTTRLGVSA